MPLRFMEGAGVGGDGGTTESVSLHAWHVDVCGILTAENGLIGFAIQIFCNSSGKSESTSHREA
jgi:hypothetical protein